METTPHKSDSTGSKNKTSNRQRATPRCKHHRHNPNTHKHTLSLSGSRIEDGGLQVYAAGEEDGGADDDNANLARRLVHDHRRKDQLQKVKGPVGEHLLSHQAQTPSAGIGWTKGVQGGDVKEGHRRTEGKR
eukprot:1170075-Rhodomonas_salina.1